MTLPWVRLDANIGSHDKVLALLNDPSDRKWQAFASYMVAIAWSGGQGTDGFIPLHALKTVHGSRTTARLLAKYGLWDEGLAGWQIRNFESRQPTRTDRESLHVASLKANCVRWHGTDCGCWKQAQ